MALFFDSGEMNISSENSGSNFSYDHHNFSSELLWEFYSALIIDIVTLVFVVSTNSYVIQLIVNGTGNGFAAEVSSLNLSVCEILGSLASISVFAQTSLDNVVFSGLTLLLMGRPLCQCLICVEHYLAVVHPVTFLKFKPLRYRLICCAFVWTVIFAFICLICLSEISHYFLAFTLVQYIFFLSIMLFCCLAVLRALKQSGLGERNREREEENHMKRQAFKVILIITVTMVIIYVPIIIAILLYIFVKWVSVMVLLIMLFTSLLVGLVHPFLFLHRVGKLPCTKCCLF